LGAGLAAHVETFRQDHLGGARRPAEVAAWFDNLAREMLEHPGEPAAGDRLL
jgi:hypothetical protein